MTHDWFSSLRAILARLNQPRPDGPPCQRCGRRIARNQTMVLVLPVGYRHDQCPNG